MDIHQTLDNIENAIQQVLDNEMNILQRGLNELNLNGHLIKYLTPFFDNFNVDPEYNGDILKPNDRKALDMAKKRMKLIGIPSNEADNYPLTPDIIIHRRNTNDFNHVVIEVKKDSSSKSRKQFDLLKLEHLTIDYMGNHYNYKLGVALVFGTKENAGTYEMTYFQNGIPTAKENLK